MHYNYINILVLIDMTAIFLLCMIFALMDNGNASSDLNFYFNTSVQNATTSETTWSFTPADNNGPCTFGSDILPSQTTLLEDKNKFFINLIGFTSNDQCQYSKGSAIFMITSSTKFKANQKVGFEVQFSCTTNITSMQYIVSAVDTLNNPIYGPSNNTFTSESKKLIISILAILGLILILM